jgi:bacillithiol biosynthesis cysteine-adding enzyme BshC
MASAFSPAFLDGESRATAFLPDDFRRADARVAAVRRAGTHAVSAQTLAALRVQAERFGGSAARSAHLEALGKPGTAVVVTGQQVGLFLGPLYSFYKAASAIAVARALSLESGQPCVPVFWLQSEDHDFQEIDHCFVQSREGAVQTLSLAVQPGDARRAVAGLTLGDGVEGVLSSLETQLEGTARLDEVMALLRRHYQPQHGWVRAFASAMSELFADEGLVLLDPRDAAFADEVHALQLRAFEARASLWEAASRRAGELEAAGFSVQVHVRPGAPLSFFHPDGPEGPRFRLEPKGDGFALVGREASVSVEQVRQAPPLCLSTSALLRPLVQDTLLPTAAIVGGPGELNYFAQMPPLYDAFGLNMPMLVPRARFRVVEPRPRAVLAALGLCAKDVEAPREAVLERVSAPVTGVRPEVLERRLDEAVSSVLSELPAGVDLRDALERTKGTFSRAASRLSARYAQALRQRDETVVMRVDKVQRALFPKGEPQERVYSWPNFAARLGVREFKALVFQRLEAFGTDVKELNP